MPDADKITDYKSYPVFYISLYTSILAFLGHLLFLILFSIFKIQPLIYVNIGSCVIFLAGYFLNRLRFHKSILILTLLEIIFHAYIATFFLGWSSGFYIYILCLLPLIYNYRILTLFWKNSLSFCLIICLVLLNLLAGNWPESYSLPSAVLANFELMNLIIAFCVILLLSVTYSVSAMDLEYQLRLKNEELDSTSRLDPLTSLSNRRDILDKLSYEREKILRNRNECCIVIADIDHFKMVNDNFGHDFGDYVIKKISSILRSELRNQDHVSRWGGEEFLLVLPDTGLTGGTKAAEKLRNKIEEHIFSFNNNTTQTTMTFGVSLYNPHQDTNVSIKNADELLYIGKKNGRNRVES